MSLKCKSLPEKKSAGKAQGGVVRRAFAAAARSSPAASRGSAPAPKGAAATAL